MRAAVRFTSAATCTGKCADYQPSAQSIFHRFNFTAGDVENHVMISAWVQHAFMANAKDKDNSWKDVTKTIDELGRLTDCVPELALGVAMVLYSYFWWEGPHSTALNVQAGVDASKQFYRSIVYNGCDAEELDLNEFAARHCNLRWRHLLMVSAEVGRHVVVHGMDQRLGLDILRKSTSYMRKVRRLPFFNRYEQVGPPMKKPHDTNFNQDFFPHVAYGPVWPLQVVPLAKFLEHNFNDFLSDLRSILNVDLFQGLHDMNRNAGSHYREFGPREDDWQTIYFVRGGSWNHMNCQIAPRTCELLGSRSEIAACAAGNSGAGFLRLRPGGRVKPHFGNAPRLAAHLGLIVPEIGDIHMMVGGQRIIWEAGKVVIFDDTFVHSVSHDGSDPRYILNVWFCHPCDRVNDETGIQDAFGACSWP